MTSEPTSASWQLASCLTEAFRGSSFTPTLRPVGATPQRLIARPVRAMEFSTQYIGARRGAPPGVHPRDATPQGLAACLDKRRRFPRIPSPRFVAHFFLPLLLLRSTHYRPPRIYVRQGGGFHASFTHE